MRNIIKKGMRNLYRLVLVIVIVGLEGVGTEDIGIGGYVFKFTLIILMLFSFYKSTYPESSQSTLKKQIFNKLVIFMSCLFFFWCAFIYSYLNDTTLSVVGHGGMKPTLESGDMVVVKNAKAFKIWSIVVYRLNEEQSNLYKTKNIPQLVIGRIVGVSTDEIEITNGILFLNGRRIIEEYSTINQKLQLKKRIIPVNYFFVLKDNRILNKGDSRELGFIQKDQVKYTVEFIHKCGRLKAKTIWIALTGLTLLMTTLGIPFYLYNKLPKTRFVKLSIQINTTFILYAIFVLIYCKTITGNDPFSPNFIIRLPIAYYYNFVSWFKFLFINPPFSTVLTAIFGWAGGVLTAIELNKKYKKLVLKK